MTSAPGGATEWCSAARLRHSLGLPGPFSASLPALLCQVLLVRITRGCLIARQVFASPPLSSLLCNEQRSAGVEAKPCVPMPWPWPCLNTLMHSSTELQRTNSPTALKIKEKKKKFFKKSTTKQEQWGFASAGTEKPPAHAWRFTAAPNAALK